MRTRTRLALVAGSFSLLVGGAMSVGGGTPASARACADVTVYTPSTDPHVGHCEPLFDNWISPCYGASHETAGYGGRVEVCHPTPV